MPIYEINGTELYCEVEGRGPPLVLLHGLGSSSQDWAIHRLALSQEWTLILPDLRGFGRSRRNRGPFTVGQLASDTLMLLHELSFGPVYALGFSMGGAVLLEMALAKPAWFRRLILVNSMDDFRPNTIKKRLDYLVRQSLLRVASLDHLSRIIARRLFPHSHQEHLRAVLRQVYSGNSKDVFFSCLESLSVWHVDSRLKDLEMPVLIMAADADYVGIEERQQMVRRFPHASLAIIKNSRHGLPFDQPQEFLKRVQEFCRKDVRIKKAE